jgi:4,5:9,10-diseco-3-hydroxy-5,9,17-trioxoandrosta-1(10),2-diene-4-oate hydrolase
MMRRLTQLFFAITLAVAQFLMPYALSAEPNDLALQRYAGWGTACNEDPSCVIVGGTHVLVWKSIKSKNIIVVCIHGLGLCAKAYKSLGKDLSEAGIDGFAINVRGFGPDRNQVQRSKLDCLKTVDDVSRLLQGLRNERPESRIVLVGESMGGALAIRIASQNPELVDGVICSAPAWKLQKIAKTAVKGVFELTFFRRARPGPAGKGVMRQATSDVDLTEHWISDRSHKLRLSLAEATSFLSFVKKTKQYARQIEKPLLIVQGMNDQLVSPSSVCKLFRSIPSRQKTLLIDCKGEHLLLEEGQYTSALLEEIIDWLTQQTIQESEPRIASLQSHELSKKQRKRLSHLIRLGRAGECKP